MHIVATVSFAVMVIRNMSSGFRGAFLILTGRIEDISANTFAIILAVFAVVVFDAPVGAPA